MNVMFIRSTLFFLYLLGTFRSFKGLPEIVFSLNDIIENTHSAKIG